MIKYRNLKRLEVKTVAYKINDKIYTDHALMDEIVYECKKIISGIVIKNDEPIHQISARYQRHRPLNDIEKRLFVHKTLQIYNKNCKYANFLVILCRETLLSAHRVYIFRAVG
jgi:hypothetical protein